MKIKMIPKMGPRMPPPRSPDIVEAALTLVEFEVELEMEVVALPQVLNIDCKADFS
jgi:hypothetical protein